MFILLVALCISEDPISGGWQTISANSEQLKPVKSFLDRNLHHLFPEMKEKYYSIKLAKIQIVNGMNVKLVIKSKPAHLLFEISLFVDHEQKVTITDIIKLPSARPTIGGFNWENPERLTAQNLDHLVDLIQTKVNLLIKKPCTAILYRKQLVNGVKTHFVFRDANQNLFSAVIVTNANEEKVELVYAIY